MTDDIAAYRSVVLAVPNTPPPYKLYPVRTGPSGWKGKRRYEEQGFFAGERRGRDPNLRCVMDTLIDLQDKLRATGLAIGRLETALAQNPSRSIMANLRSLKKLESSLNDEFAEVADLAGIDICRYRILDDRPSAKALAVVTSMIPPNEPLRRAGGIWGDEIRDDSKFPLAHRLTGLL